MTIGSNRIRVATLLLLAMLMFSGCGSSVKELGAIYDSNIKKAHLCYTIFMEQHRYMGPKDEAELRKFISEDKSGRFLAERAGIAVDNLDSVFVSERDGEPLVFRFGVKGVADHAVVFEKTGVEGMRYVALGKPIEVDEEQYDKYLKGEIKPERASENAMFEDMQEPK